MPALATAIVIVAAWVGLSWFARMHSDTDHLGWALAEWWAQSGKWYLFCALVLFFLGAAFGLEGPEMRTMPRFLFSSTAAGQNSLTQLQAPGSVPESAS